MRQEQSVSCQAGAGAGVQVGVHPGWVNDAGTRLAQRAGEEEQTSAFLSGVSLGTRAMDNGAGHSGGRVAELLETRVDHQPTGIARDNVECRTHRTTIISNVN